MKTIILETLRFVNANLRNPMNRAPLPCRSFLILLVIACFALLPKAQAAPEGVPAAPDIPAHLNRPVIRVQATPRIVPAVPETALAGFNTADGDHALFSITTGIANSAFGWFSLRSNTDGSFNTAIGAGTLVLNIGDQTTGEGLENTAVGAAALLFNTTGSNNTALGALALENNDSGSGNTATGIQALQNNNSSANTATGFFAQLQNTSGFNNAAFGVRPLENNTGGSNNTAIGNLALQNSQGDQNTALGRQAGSGVTTANNVTAIGHGVSGVSTTNGQVDNSCYIGSIFNGGVDAGTAVFVFVDQDGKLGTTALPNTGTLPSTQAFSGRVQELETTVAQQAKAIEVLTAQLKEQAAQVQKVSAQLELSKPAAQTVVNNQ